MRNTISSKWTQASAIAILIVFLAPIPLLYGPEPTRYVLAEIRGIGLAPVAAAGASVVEDYEGTLALLRVTPSHAARLRAFGVPLTELPDRTVLDFREAGIRFDTAAGEPVLPASLRAVDPTAFVVQFRGPIKAEWIGEMRALGAVPHLYTLHNAYVVRMSPDLVPSVRAIPAVEFVGAYHPAYKLSASLRLASGTVRVAVIAFDGTTEAGLAGSLEALGASVVWTSPVPVMAQALLDASLLPDIARLEFVASILPDDVKQPLDLRSGIVHGFHRAWYQETSGLPFTLTGVSNGADGIRGTGDDIYEIAGISDTGLDEGSATAGTNDFFKGPFGDPAVNDRVVRFTDRTGCSVPDGALGGRTAHGSHVAGIVASNGYSWEKYLIEDRGETSVSLTDFRWDRSEAGVAPEAKVTVDGVNGCGGGVQPSPSYWLAQYTDGARVMVNSWGGGVANYNGNAFAVDDQMDDSDADGSDDRLIEFSAGNMGPDIGSMSGDAQAKNGLAIGASQNFRPDQLEADNPNLLADFSSRGGPSQSSGRVKPDLVAIGTAVVSLFARGEWTGQINPDYIMFVDKYHALNRDLGADGIPDYRYLQGTSMSGPMAAGLYLLAREYLREVHGIANPRSQLVKAFLINGAVRMDPALYPYPGYDQGWGRIDLPNALFPNPPKTVQFEESSIPSTGGTWSPTGINLNVESGRVPLKITLVWIDAPMSFGDLARDLNLRVTAPSGAVYCGNNYNPTGWSISFAGPGCGAGSTVWDPDGNGWDEVNNVEQVEVEVPEAGAWQVEVSGFNVPSAARFALVVSADVGSTAQYLVDLSTNAITTFSVARSGSVNLPVVVSNFGSQVDNVLLASPNAPPGISVRFAPTGPVLLTPDGGQDVLATLQVASGVAPGLYRFDLRATSDNDPSPSPSSDYIPIQLEVTDDEIPTPMQITSGPTDELDPSVVVFNSTTGARHLFIAYRKTSPVLPGGDLGGVNVWVAHATLDNNGMPDLPFEHIGISGANDDPNDLRILNIPSGTFADRVVITWTGTDPNVTNPDLASYGRVAYADAPYTTWNLRTMELNVGSSTYNIARVSFPLFRRAGGGNGELMWVWEHLDYQNLQGNPLRVQTHFTSSTDGGNSWSAPFRVFPVSGTDQNFYFFPHGTIDQNDVAWIWAYFRTPTGNDRDLSVRLYDGAWSATAPVVWDTTDNIQWPAVLSTNEGPNGNRVYVVVTRDALAVDLKMWVTYVDEGATPWSSSNVPRSSFGGRNCGTGCTISLDLQGPYGPFGLSVSNAVYNRRPILNFVETVEAGTHYLWLPYMENNNPFGVPNMWTYYTTNFASGSPSLTRVTSDGFAKGHQMTSTLTTNNVARLYEVYHASQGTETDVDYQVFLAIYHRNWESDSDAAGPRTNRAASVPTLVNLSQASTVRIAANVNDMATGNSTVEDAEFFFDAPGAPGTGRPMAASDGTFDAPTEGVQILAGVPDTWLSPSCHPIYIRGKDAAQNWGAVDSTTVCVEGSSGPDTTPPLPAVARGARLVGATLADVEVVWAPAPDEGFLGGTVEYRVLRSSTLGGTYVDISGPVTATGLLQYSFVDVGVGSNTYFYKIESEDSVGFTANSTGRLGRTEFNLPTGVSAVSVPFAQLDESLPTVLQTVTVRYAWTYDGCTGTWKSFDALRAPGRNSLRSLAHAQGLYVDLPAPDVFAVAGLVPASTTITLCAGWNFVGYPTFRSGYTVASLKGETGATSVLGYANVPPGYTTVLPDTMVLANGAAYWVKVGAPTVWIVPGQ